MPFIQSVNALLLTECTASKPCSLICLHGNVEDLYIQNRSHNEKKKDGTSQKVQNIAYLGQNATVTNTIFNKASESIIGNCREL